MPFYNPSIPTTVCWGCTIPIHDKVPFYSLFENPFLVTYLHPLLSVPCIFSLQLSVHFVIHSDLTFLVAIPPTSLSQYFIPTFPLHFVHSLLNIIMFTYPQPSIHQYFTIFQCSDSSSFLPAWVISSVCVHRTPRPGSYVPNSTLVAHSMSSPTIMPGRMSNNLWETGPLLP